MRSPDPPPGVCLAFINVPGLFRQFDAHAHAHMSRTDKTRHGTARLGFWIGLDGVIILN